MTAIEKIAAARAARDPRCTDSTGAAWRSPEKRQFYDDVQAWKANGSPASEKAALDARKAALRAADLW